MSLTRLALRFAAPVPKIESFQRCLFLGPHPDDIEIGAGATAARLAEEGKDICFLICTDGRFGLANAPKGTTQEELIRIRKGEARQSAALLGVKDLRFLDFCDGAHYSRDDLTQAIARVVGEFQPDLIFAPDPDVSSECHPDHRNVGEAAKTVSCFAPYPELMESYSSSAAPVKALAFYMTARPNCYVKTGRCLQRQLEAIFSCHLSQFPPDSQDAKSITLYLKLRARDHGIRCLSPSAEGFRVLGQTQMHCLPEAGHS